MSSGDRSRVWAWSLVPVALVLAVSAGPFVVGDGIDVPDDALYTTVSTWEWVRTAVRSGRSPFFVPGAMGGVSLFTNPNQLGPLYPAMWLAFVLPVRVALPLAFVLHGIGTLLAVRWLARCYGAGPMAATAAGLVIAGGPVGLLAYMECQTDSWPLIMWFPVILACLRKNELAPETRTKLAWALLAGLALAAMLMGGHIRHSAGVCGALGVWFIIRGRGLGWAMLATVVGLVAGATGYVPVVLELLDVRSVHSMTAAMSIPHYQALHWTFLSSWMVQHPYTSPREHSLGTILAVCFLVGAYAAVRKEGSTRDGVGRLVVYACVLVLAAAGIPGVRWLLLPLTWLSFPTLVLYSSLAMVPAAVVGAIGLDVLLARSRSDVPRLIRWPVALAVLLLLVFVGLRLVLGDPTWSAADQRDAYVLGVVQAGLVAMLAMGVVGRTRWPVGRRSGLLVVLIGLDIAALGVRYHVAIPTRSLDLSDREHVEGEDILRDGYLNIDEMVQLFQGGFELVETPQSVMARGMLDVEDMEMDWGPGDHPTAAMLVQDALLDRRWPVHLGLSRGWRSLSGRVKLPPPRQVRMLLPLSRRLDSITPWRDTPAHRGSDPPLLQELFGSPDSIGARTMALHGIPLAVGEGNVFFRAEGLAPRCYSPTHFEFIPDPVERVRRLLDGSFSEDGPAFVEQQRLAAPSRARATVSCEPEGRRIEVSAASGSVVVLRERLHSGWSARIEETGQKLEIFAVNQVHMGVEVPGGDHVVVWRFRPPGLIVATSLAAPTWLLALAFAGVGLRRR